jgi:hypothetical protein
MLDMAFGLTDTSRLGCQVHLTKELDGMDATLPSATRNMFVDGEWHFYRLCGTFSEEGDGQLQARNLHIIEVSLSRIYHLSPQYTPSLSISHSQGKETGHMSFAKLQIYRLSEANSLCGMEYSLTCQLDAGRCCLLCQATPAARWNIAPLMV